MYILFSHLIDEVWNEYIKLVLSKGWSRDIVDNDYQYHLIFRIQYIKGGVIFA